MLEHLKKYDILLASNSPRRRELLAGLDIEYAVTALPDVDESYPDILEGEEIPLYISREKAMAYRNSMKDNTLLITADTIVWFGGKVFGKPRDKEEAKEMLRELSGRSHTGDNRGYSMYPEKKSIVRRFYPRILCRIGRKGNRLLCGKIFTFR